LAHHQGFLNVAELPPGYAEISPEDRKKAKVFFDRGNTVAGTGNYDYAIEMYISGLAIDPDAVEAHQTLRDISLKRKASGGKSIGMFEAMKLKRPTKDDKQNLLNNEKLLASDPGNTDHMVGVLQNALRGGFYDTVMWLGPILQQANADSGKPEVNKFIILRDAYKALKQWKKASDACHYAAMLRPDDMDLQKELKDLGAMDTMDQGKYGTSSSFRESIKDMDGQSKLMVQDKDVRTMDQMSRLILDAENQYKADAQDPGKIMKYVEILAKTELPEHENKAIDLLQDTFDRTKQFRFRMAIGKIRIAQLGRMERTLRQAVQADPNNAEAKQDYAQFRQEKINEELKEYELAAENYPTEANLRYQVAVRLCLLGKYNEAIPILQQVRQDPKLRTDASVALGRAFLDAGFADEAVDTLGVVISDYVNKGDKRSIEMTYLYGRALEQKGDREAAIKAYSQVTQWDFNFLDTQARLKKMREKPPEGGN
jgi:tetratricopeptide (TPR) repeat protein